MKDKDSFSCTKGYSFSFEDDGNLIEAWFSAFSGLEKVIVNGELASRQRNYSKNTTNTFKINNDSYSTSLVVVNIFKGPFICTLVKNGKPFKRKRLIFHVWGGENNNKSFISALLLYIALGILLGVANSYLNLPDLVVFGFIIAVVVIAGIFNKISKHQNMVDIVEEEVA